jgi:GNAT superfamily N-acetyltransferase
VIGEPGNQALVAVDGFVPRATNMVLELDRPIADPAPVELHGMTQDEFDAFVATLVEGYAEELAAAGMEPAAARVRSEEQTAGLIHAGRDTPGQVFFTAEADGSPVGRLWLSTEGRMAFVYDVVVDESHRRRGYGEGIMNAGARWSRDHGHPVLGLNVFAHNVGARALYDKLGYRVTVDFRTHDVADGG